MSLDNSLLDVYVHSYLAALDCPRSLAVQLMYAHGEHAQLAQLTWDPHHYNDVSTAADSLAATKFLSKAEFLNTGINREEVAMAGFVDAERQCREANRRIWSGTFDPVHHAIVDQAAALVDKLLGSFDAEEFVDSCSWGPGASVSVKRRQACRPHKFRVESGITPACYDFVRNWFHVAYPHWVPDFEIQPSSKIVTVPKDAKRDRIIAIEPGINLWFQKGVGSMLRKRLRASGVNLDNQCINQERARVGSRYNHLATIDFASASDTVSQAVVHRLLPGPWYAVCDALRTTSGVYKDETFFFSKFSSMGNGFTFELESLIFYALARAVCSHLGVSSRGISVYGDDVVIPCEAVDLYTSVCATCGFTTNKSKSYFSSPYRESCGEHFWGGVSIKPIFLKETLNGKTALLKSANNVRRYAHRRNTFGCDRRFWTTWQIFTDILGDVPRISEGYGDGGLIVNLDESTATKAKHGVEGYMTRCWAVVPLRKQMTHRGVLLDKLHAIGASPCDLPLYFDGGDQPASGNEIPMSGRVRHTKTRMLIRQWYDLGPWI